MDELGVEVTVSVHQENREVSCNGLETVGRSSLEKEIKFVTVGVPHWHTESLIDELKTTC